MRHSNNRQRLCLRKRAEWRARLQAQSGLLPILSTHVFLCLHGPTTSACDSTRAVVGDPEAHCSSRHLISWKRDDRRQSRFTVSAQTCPLESIARVSRALTCSSLHQVTVHSRRSASGGRGRSPPRSAAARPSFSARGGSVWRRYFLFVGTYFQVCKRYACK